VWGSETSGQALGRGRRPAPSASGAGVINDGVSIRELNAQCPLDCRQVLSATSTNRPTSPGPGWRLNQLFILIDRHAEGRIAISV
jgi:hypothetical protein